MQSPNSRRPRVVCHMTVSIDGRIIVDGWPASVAGAVHREYERIHVWYAAEGWMCGRITMEPFAGAVRSPDDIARKHNGTPREDFVVPGKHDTCAFAIDAKGRLAWQSGDINGDHVVAIVGNRVSEDYLRLLRQRGVSYLLAGTNEVDLNLALEKIHARFGVKTLLLEGGGLINGTLLDAGLIDEVSLIIAPVVDGRVGTASLFDVDKHATPGLLELEGAEPLGDGLLWLRYRVASSLK